MAATHNPNFETEHRALVGIKHIKRACIGFESLQILAGILFLVISVLSNRFGPLLRLYSVFVYFFFSAFAHAVALYVLVTLKRNFQQILASPGFLPRPEATQEDLVRVIRQGTWLPAAVGIHGALLVGVLSTNARGLQTPARIITFLSIIAGVAVMILVTKNVQLATKTLRAFLTSKTLKASLSIGFVVLALLTAGASISACASTGRLTAQTNDQSASASPSPLGTDEIAIIATTDFHATIDRAEIFAKAIRDLRSKFGEASVHLDGGDLFQGSMEGNIPKGRSVVELYNLLGVDAAAIGNHELDYGNDPTGPNPRDGMGNIKARAKEAKFRWLSVNIVAKARDGRPISCRPSAKDPRCNASGQRTVFASWAKFTRAGLGVCVVGATTPITPHITQPAFVKDVIFEQLSQTVGPQAEWLRKNLGCDFVIATMHAGLACDVNGKCSERGDVAEALHLLEGLPEGTLDAIVAGHTHLKAFEVIRGTPVIEAASNAKLVGVLRLSKSRKHAFDGFVDVTKIDPKPAPDTNDITLAMEPYRKTAREKKAVVVGKAKAPFTRNYSGEAALGNLVADALRRSGHATADASIGLVNAGGLRADLPAGTLTYGDIFGALPFDNSLAVVELKGSELKRVLEIATSGGHGVAGISGLEIKLLDVKPGEKGYWSRDLNGDGLQEDWERNRIAEIRDADGKLIDDQKSYKLASMDFFVMGGDHQTFVFDKVPQSRKHYYTGIWQRDVLIDYLKETGEIDPENYYNPARRRIEFVTPVR